MSWLPTFGGIRFHFSEDRNVITITDIARSLSMQCRYNGHVIRFYSVAEHCVLLSRAVAPKNARWALLHDAAEAYLGDMVHPLRQQLPEFGRIDERITAQIYRRFGLATATPEQVKSYDRRIVLDEADVLTWWDPSEWPPLRGYKPLGVAVTGWSPDRAEAEYLSRFRQLFK